MTSKIIFIVVVFMAGFALHYYIHRPDEVDKRQSNDVVTDDTTTTVQTPDGTTKIVRVVRTVDRTKIVEVKTASKASVYNLSALAMIDTSKGLLVPIYGVSVSKEVIGTAGVFGYTNGIVGLSIGLNF